MAEVAKEQSVRASLVRPYAQWLLQAFETIPQRQDQVLILKLIEGLGQRKATPGIIAARSNSAMSRACNQFGNLAKEACGNPVCAVLVFLNLLKGHTERVGERSLWQGDSKPMAADVGGYEQVDRLRSLGRAHAALPGVGVAAPQPKSCRASWLRTLTLNDLAITF